MGWLDAVDVVADQTRRAIERQAAETPAQQMEDAHQQQVLAARKNVLMQRWANAAPTIPSGALMSFAQNGVTPESELGSWVIGQAVPAVQQKQGVVPPLQSGGIAPEQVQQNAQIARQHTSELAGMGIINPSQIGQLSGPDLFDALGKVSRPVLGALQGGYEALQAGVRAKSAMPGIADPENVAIESNPLMPQNVRQQAKADVTQGRFGTTVHGIKYGTENQVLDLGSQTTLGQAIFHGKSLGSGLFPSGEAQQAAAKAQQAAASINGHALTPGRAGASLVFTPGSKPYQVLSGAVDFGVAMEADPASLALGSLSDAVKAAHTFAPLTDNAIGAAADHLIDRLGPTNAAALQEWAGNPNDLRQGIVDKITNNPASLSELTDSGVTTPSELASAIEGRKAGLVDGLRRSVNPKDALTWLNGPQGKKVVDRFVASNGTDIYLKSGKKIPAPVAYALGDATSEADVRNILAENIGKDIANVPSSYQWAHPFDGLRWFSHLPNYAVDSEDPDMMVQRALQELQVGKVPKSEWNGLLAPLANAQDTTDALNGYKAVGNRIGDEILARDPVYQNRFSAFNDAKAELERTDVETPEYRQLKGQVSAAQRNARQLTTYFQRNAAEDQKYWVDAMGDTPHVPGLSLDGETTPIEGPYAVSELLNRSIPVIGGDGNTGIRNIKRAVSSTQRFWNIPGINQTRNGATYLADHLTQAFKIGALARVALPVRFLADEQARMASAGVDSMFHHPISYLSYVLNAPNAEDVTGEKFIEQLSDHQSKVTQAIGQSSRMSEELRGASDKVFAKGWGTYAREDPNYVWSWGDRLSQAHVDDVGKQVAKAITDPESTGGLDAIKQAFWDGNLSNARAQLVKADLKWGSANMVNRAQADAYIDGWAQRLNDLTGGQQDLMEAVASGEPWRGGQTSNGFRKVLSSYRDQAVGPQSVVGPIAFDNEHFSALKRATNTMFSALMSAPTGKLTRSPAFRQFYYKRIGELLPYMSAEDAAAAVDRAATNGSRLTRGVEAAGEKIGLADADNIAKSYALKQSHDLLYYPGARSNVADTLRNVAPFGEAWKNVIGTWAKLAASNPQTIRRVQQGVTDARESGWWYKDPQDGVEKFTVLPSGIMQDLSGVPFPLVAPVHGLNIAAQGLPGVGPAVSWPASYLLSQFHDVPAINALHQMILPYGDPDFSGGTAEILFPGWLNKLKTTGWFNKLPGLGQSADEKMVLSNVQKQAFQYYLSTGHYDISNPDVFEALTKKSAKTAQALYMWRGLAQFASPAAPNYTPQTKLKDGGLIETYKLAQDYKTMLDGSGGDSYKATLQFVNKYGADRILSSGTGTYGEPYTRTSIFGLPTTAQAEAWRTAHGAFADKYPTLYGYWTPQDKAGNFDYNAYLQQIHDGQRQPLDVKTWTELAEARLGNAIYSTARSKLPASMNDPQRSWLQSIQDELTQKFPGFNMDSLKPAKDTEVQTITQLRHAINDPAVHNTDLAKAAGTYLQLRDEALASAKDRGYSSISGQSTSDLRQWLFNAGTAIATKYPAFQSMWDYLFMHEVDPNA